MNTRMAKRSRFLSLVLRHRPEAAGIQLDEAGWVEVSRLLVGLAAAGHPISQKELEHLVRDNDKQRFAFSDDGRRIRANQGHSVEVSLDLKAAIPPQVLYHGTVAKFLEPIFAEGLRAGKRHHVHLSADRHTAFKVGSRRGAAVILEVDARHMSEQGYAFYLSANGVWLTDSVPVAFLKQVSESFSE